MGITFKKYLEQRLFEDNPPSSTPSPNTPSDPSAGGIPPSPSGDPLGGMGGGMGDPSGQPPSQPKKPINITTVWDAIKHYLGDKSEYKPNNKPDFNMTKNDKQPPKPKSLIK